MLKILLVEDNSLNQKLMDYYLKEHYHVTIANSGNEAIKLFTETKFDLILMDIMMPGMDGYKTTCEIRMIEKQENRINFTPIIAITAFFYDNEREKCLASGMNEFMTKPFDLNKLKEIIVNLKLQESEENE